VDFDSFVLAMNKNEMRVMEQSKKETNISSSIWYVRYLDLVCYHIVVALYIIDQTVSFMTISYFTHKCK